MKMGMPAHRFLAATNANDTVPVYLNGGDFTPKKSVQTISNAMDVGNPSNFDRILSLFDGNREKIRKYIKGFRDRKSTRLNSSHVAISYAVFCLKKKNTLEIPMAFVYLISPISGVMITYYKILHTKNLLERNGKTSSKCTPS